MTDGLEISEITYKDLEKIIDYRIEAEYFNSKFIKNDEALDQIPTITFHKVASVQNGRAYSSEKFSADGDIRIAKIGDVTNKKATAFWEKLERNEFVLQNGKLLNDNDLLMTLTGDPPDVGKVSLIKKDGEECTWNQRVARIISKGFYISNYVLYAVLSSEFCRSQMERYAKGIRQRNLGNDCFKYVRLPSFGSVLQQAIHDTVLRSEQCLEEADFLYNASENILNGFLNIGAYGDRGYAVKTLSDSFMQSGRLDAEYYQSKYENLITQINTKEAVLSLCNLYDSNFIPESNNEYRYIELSSVGVSGNILNVEKIIGNNLPSRARRLVHKGQVIVSSIEGSLSSCALIDSEYDGAVCSTGFYVIDSDKINSETLLVLFKSKRIQTLLKQRCSGTILTAISKDEFLNMPLPYIGEDIQKEISEKVQESFRLRKEAKIYLENAIKAVEMAIETGEETALRWLNR